MQGIDALEEKWNEQQAKVIEAQKKVDSLRVELNITDSDPMSTMPSPVLSADAVRQVQMQITSLETDQVRLERQLEALEKLSAPDLRVAIQTAVGSDSELGILLGALSTAEARLIDLENTHSPEHPAYKSAQKQRDDLDGRIQARVNGIMLGLRTRADAGQAALVNLKENLAEARRSDRETAERSRPYHVAKQTLAEVQQFHTILGMRIASEQTELSIPRAATVSIVDNASTPKRPMAPNRPRAIALIGLGVVLSLAGLALLRGKGGTEAAAPTA